MGCPSCVLAIALLVASAPAVASEGSAWLALERERSAEAARMPAPWRDALSRMSATQLEALRTGASADAIVLDGGVTLADFLAERGIVGVPPAIAGTPAPGSASAGGLRIEATFAPTGATTPNGSLSGGTFRLDPLLAGGGGTSTAGAPVFRIDASVSQAVVAGANSSQATVRSGFWTASDAVAVDRVFRDGFE